MYNIIYRDPLLQSPLVDQHHGLERQHDVARVVHLLQQAGDPKVSVKVARICVSLLLGISDMVNCLTFDQSEFTSTCIHYVEVLLYESRSVTSGGFGHIVSRERRMKEGV